jgi:predicted metal-dependent hydrolase
VRNSGAAAPLSVPRLTLHQRPQQTAEPAQICDALQRKMQRRDRRIITERCTVIAPGLRMAMCQLSLNSASTRWGRASVDGLLRLNWQLVLLCRAVIDHSATHQLAQLGEMSYGHAFWNVVSRALAGLEYAHSALRTAVLPVSYGPTNSRAQPNRP